MKALIPNGKILILLFNGFGDAFLALPALRHIARRSQNARIYMACYAEQITTLFADLPFQFIPGRAAFADQVTLDEDLGRIGFQQAVSFNAYYPSAADKEVHDRFPNIARWGFCNARGEPLTSLVKTARHMRDQYFEVLGWDPAYSLSDRQVFMPAQSSKSCSDLRDELSARYGEQFYTLHLDSLPEKMWTVGNWIELIAHIWSHWRAWPLIIGEESADATRLVDSFSFAHKIPSTAGIAVHFAAVKVAKAFIGIDSIFAHVADSYQKPMTTLFGPSDPVVWGSVGPLSLIVRPDHGSEMGQITLNRVVEVADLVFKSASYGNPGAATN